MLDIDFSQKMNYQRPASEFKPLTDKYEVIRQFESDRGRIINSAAIRRLQQKTQVFPLERNSAVRSRLTHSLEVQQVGRYITKEIINRLRQTGRLEELGLIELQEPFESLVEMACLMHDIGNPPFGHFGEAAISDWFEQNLNQTALNTYQLPNAISESLQQLKQKIRQDLIHFEGNAQGIRIVYTLQKLNLTYAQTACILKYTRPAYWMGPALEQHNYLMKKPGYYLAEEPFVEKLWQQLDIPAHNRYPLTYIMEAADDISYCIADLEDAVEKNILTVDRLYQYLAEAWQQQRIATSDDLFVQTVGAAYQQYQRGKKEAVGYQNDQFFLTLRVKTVNKLVPYVAQRFIDNLATIFVGEFDQPIIDDTLERADQVAESRLLGIYKQVAFQHVFRHDEVEELELQGYRIITGLLDIYGTLLKIPYVEFDKLVKEDGHKQYPIESRLFHKLSLKHRVAYQNAVEEKQSLPEEERELWEFYYRARLIQDYISGMTDHYAYDEYRKLTISG